MENRVTRGTVVKKINKVEYTKMGEKTTICTLTMKNGFEVCGFSSCVDPKNFNVFTGKDLAYEDAVQKATLLEAYLLQEKMHTPNKFTEAEAAATFLVEQGLEKVEFATAIELMGRISKLAGRLDV